jgi:hypothetical protein
MLDWSLILRRISDTSREFELHLARSMYDEEEETRRSLVWGRVASDFGRRKSPAVLGPVHKFLS